MAGTSRYVPKYEIVFGRRAARRRVVIFVVVAVVAVVVPPSFLAGEEPIGQKGRFTDSRFTAENERWVGVSGGGGYVDGWRRCRGAVLVIVRILVVVRRGYVTVSFEMGGELGTWYKDIECVFVYEGGVKC